MLPYRYLAMSPGIFGAEPDVFRPERFLETDEKTGRITNNSLQRNRSFLPFANGIHKCPGRVITRKVSLLFAALIVHRYSIKPLDEVPPMDLTKPPLGPVEPVEGSNLRLLVKPRSASPIQ